MATTKPRPPLERPPERQRKRPGVRYVRREPLPPLESSKARVLSKNTKDSTKQRSNGIRETESTATARPTTAIRRPKRAALPEVQRVKRVNERKDGQSSKVSSRPAEDRSVRRSLERELTPHHRHSTGSRPKKVRTFYYLVERHLHYNYTECIFHHRCLLKTVVQPPGGNLLR